MDRIVISNLVIFAKHGVFKEEKKLGQKFLLDIILNLDTQEAGISKNLEKTVNYGLLANEINELFTKKSNDLIETCGEEIALFVLKKYPIVNEVHVKIKKPWAPIGLPLDNVFVEIKRKRRRVFLGLGSNQGNSKKLIEKAISKIENEYNEVVKQSSLYNTKAWGLENQPDFVNAVVEIKTIYTPKNLLKHIQEIELKLGRERKIFWGARTIDIDILFVDDCVIYTDDLVVPHPYIQERNFVLEPMKEIAPHFIHPVLNKSVRVLYDELNR